MGAHLLGWTTTPWTLISNTGLAVAAQAPYVMVEQEGERYVLAEDRLARRPAGRAVRWVGEFDGATLVGSRYEPLYPNVEGAHRVVAADFVSLEDGTGVVHLAPAFGPEDLEIGRREGWATFKPLDGEGRFTDEAPAFVRGAFFKDADEAIIAGPAFARAAAAGRDARARVSPVLAVRHAADLHREELLVRADDRASRTGCSR